MLWTRFKRFYNKEDFNYSTGHVDPKKFHSIFFWFQTAYQVLDEPPERWTHVYLAIFVICGTMPMVEFSLLFYHAVDIFDLGLMIEAANYVLVLFYTMMTFVIAKYNVSDFVYLIKAIKEDYELISTKNEKYRNAFFANQLATWQASILVAAFMMLAGIMLLSFTVGTVAFYYITHTPGDGTHRQLVFPYWAPGIDFTATPYFEIAFVVGNTACLTCPFSYIFALNTNIVWIREIASKAEVIGGRIKDLLEGIHLTNDEAQKLHNARLINIRMREIVSQHVTMYSLLDRYASVYKKCLMYDQFIISPMICMSAYCYVAKTDVGDLHLVMLVVCIVSTVMLLGPCYLCTYLRTKLTDISDICYETRFWEAGPRIRVYLIIVMQRSLRPLPLQMAGFQEVSLQTFSSKMVSAYSLFNMLRQINLEI